MNEKPSITLKNYRPGSMIVKKSFIICGLWYYTNILFFRSYLFPSSRFKMFILRLFGAKIGKGIVVKPGVNIKYPWLLEIGEYTWIGEGVWIDNLTTVKIGSNVCISQGAMLLTGNHDFKKTSFDLIVGSVILENGVWIGAKSVVCPGVKCNTHSVLSVSSVATHDLESYFIYQGNPALKIRERNLTS
jgi:putative colanic acid biosynthesis acetyltransferase WcaF